MRNRRIVIIVGTRPQIIKSAPVLKAFSKITSYECSIINTGQHYDFEMNRQFFRELELPEPEVNLNVGQGDANEQLSGIINSLNRHLTEKKVDLAIVPGDTNSALAAGIACSKLGIKIAHLEAGCRSYDFRMSEEINRRVLDHISQILLCPTQLSYDNVLAERVWAPLVENVGDTMLDSLLDCMSSIDQNDSTKRLALEPNKFAFLTTHRAENVDHERELVSILNGVGSFDIPVLFPIHPRTRARIDEFGVEIPENMILINPLPYYDTLRLVKDSKLVVTDSGGLQKESYWLNRPSLILRDTVEWMEIINSGAGILTGSDQSRIRDAYTKLNNVSLSIDSGRKLFGDGKASQRVVRTVNRFFSESGGIEENQQLKNRSAA